MAASYLADWFGRRIGVSIGIIVLITGMILQGEAVPCPSSQKPILILPKWFQRRMKECTLVAGFSLGWGEYLQDGSAAS